MIIDQPKNIFTNIIGARFLWPLLLAKKDGRKYSPIKRSMKATLRIICRMSIMILLV